MTQFSSLIWFWPFMNFLHQTIPWLFLKISTPDDLHVLLSPMEDIQSTSFHVFTTPAPHLAYSEQFFHLQKISQTFDLLEVHPVILLVGSVISSRISSNIPGSAMLLLFSHEKFSQVSKIYIELLLAWKMHITWMESILYISHSNI